VARGVAHDFTISGALLVVPLLVLSTLAYRLIEKPGRTYLASFAKSLRTPRPALHSTTP
jgi:hypothetical protein